MRAGDFDVWNVLALIGSRSERFSCPKCEGPLCEDAPGSLTPENFFGACYWCDGELRAFLGWSEPDERDVRWVDRELRTFLLGRFSSTRVLH